jgi:beta-lactamase regulating signal transducer with metallopeptidase domain
MIPSLIEIALRALLLAAAVWAGLRLLRVRDVLAQKTAWGMVLAVSFLMPLLLPMVPRLGVLPAGITLALPQGLASPAIKAAAPKTPIAANHRSYVASAAPGSVELVATQRSAPVSAAAEPMPLAPLSTEPHSTIQTPPPPDFSRPSQARSVLPAIETIAFALYLAVCGALMVRLIFGLSSAISLWRDAEPVDLAHAGDLALRVSRAVSSPVTVGSGVVLPADFDEWESEKLRIVLAHERSHIRQGDFYVQLLAGVYAALFWFSPLGWWLKRKLSDLGEAISDRAGLEEAASRSSYAQILLEFAGLPRPTPIGVAMARTSSLSHRIERLLNDSSFRQAFNCSRRRALVAALLVPAAFVAATSLIRVQAAGQQTAATPPAQSSEPATGVSNPDNVIVASPEAPVVPPVAPAAPVAARPTPDAPGRPETTVVPQNASPVPPSPQAPNPPGSDDNVTVGAGESLTITHSETNTNSNTNGHRRYSLQSGTGDGFRFSFRSDDDDSYALVTGPVGNVRFSGDWIDGRRQEIDKASRMAHGKFLWFTHEGKSYVIDDAAIIDSIDAMYKPMDELGRKQEELGKQQEALGKQQEALGHKQEQASVPTPDVSKEMAELSAALAKLQAKKGGTVTQDELSDLQGKIGDLQGRLGDVEGKIGEEQGRLGEEQGKLGEQQGKLGEEQGRLGEEQGRIAREADLKVRSIIEESLRNGKAKPVE